jgi:diguanylate cyclase (GGDEF)-like protein
MTRLIHSNCPIDQVVHSLVDEMKGLLGAARGSVLILDEDSQKLAFHDSSGLNAWELENITFRLGEGVAGWVAQHREPLLLEDVQSDPRFKRISGQSAKFSSMICVPLEMRRRLVGVMTLTTETEGHIFTQDDLDLVKLLAAHISLALESHRLYELSVMDGLTRIYNRRYLDQRLSEELSDSRRHKRPLTIGLLDLDHFKKLNDQYGHQAGDKVLCDVTETISEMLREHDVVARYGGEEFALVLSSTPRSAGLDLGERVRQRIAEQGFTYGEQVLPVTISLGLASFPEDGTTRESLLKAADKALYKAKEAGRNRVMVAGSFR